MTRFKFRLSRVLRVRRVEEQAASNRFKECLAVVHRSEEVAQTLGNQLRRSRDELFETRAHKRVPPAELLLAHNTLQTLEESLAGQRQRIAELQLEADRLRSLWEAARQDRLALEQLEDRRKRDHLDEEEQRANLELDETALRRATEATREASKQADSRTTPAAAENTTSPDRTLPR